MRPDIFCWCPRRLRPRAVELADHRLVLLEAREGARCKQPLAVACRGQALVRAPAMSHERTIHPGARAHGRRLPVSDQRRAPAASSLSSFPHRL